MDYANNFTKLLDDEASETSRRVAALQFASGCVAPLDHKLVSSVRLKKGEANYLAMSTNLHTSNKVIWATIFLGTITFWLYSPSLKYGFCNYDDPLYVTSNETVQNGISFGAIKWAFTDLKYFYHPITWVSLCLDATISGSNAGGFHLTNLWIHIANSLLLFYWLRLATEHFWQSLTVASIFALHPINSETVLWISERKGLLSTTFFLVALVAYTQYAKAPSAFRYIMLLMSYILSLMCKSMLVTLPFLLLLLDIWPLRRLPSNSMNWGALISEKLPLIGISCIFCVLTYLAQNTAGALAPSTSFPIGMRLSNAVIGYSVYLARFYYPNRLSVCYPYPEPPSWLALLLALSLVCVLSHVVIRLGLSHRRYMLVGWFWFLLPSP